PVDDLVDVDRGAPKAVTEGVPVEHEPACVHVRPQAVHRRESALCREICNPCAVENEHAVCQDEQGAGTLAGQRRKYVVELISPASLEPLKLEAQRAGRGARLLHPSGMGTIARIREHGYPRESWEHLLEQLDLLPRQLGASKG